MNAIKRMKLFVIGNVLNSLKVLISTSASGITWLKISATLKLSLLISPVLILSGIESWMDANAIYVLCVSLAIFVDYVLGSIKHLFWLRDWHWRDNIKDVLIKLILVLAVGGTFEGLSLITREYANLLHPFLTILRTAVFLYPGASIIRSARVMSGGKFPPEGILKRIEALADQIQKDPDLRK